jgi:ribosomal protein S18 acetylase RimI-like enzyme
MTIPGATEPGNGPAIVLRPAIRADVDRLVEIENRIFAGDRISRRSFLRYLTAPTCVTIVAALSREITGYALVAFRTNSPKARIYSLAVESAEGRGIGSALLGACEDAARRHGKTSIHLEVDENNARAIRLYDRFGFHKTGRREDYYESGAAALLFEKTLVADQGPRTTRSRANR